MTESTLAPWDKILPNQPFNSDQFADRGPVEKAIYETAIRVSGLKSPAAQFKLENTPMFTIEQMASSPVTLGIIQWLIHLAGARRVIEIGAFIGVSALYMASALPAGGEVVTIEKFDHFAAIARRNFAANGLADRITLMLGDAHEVIPQLPPDRKFDLAFIDGNKERYADYVRLLEPLVRPGGIMVVDDALFHGDAINAEPRSDKGKGVRATLDLAAGLTAWQRVLLPVSNGMLLMIKPG